MGTLLNRDRYAALFQRLERLYCVGTPNLQVLRNLSDCIMAKAGADGQLPDEVTITTNSYEGASATGTLVFESALTLKVIEDLLLKYDANLRCLRPARVQSSAWMNPVSP